METHFETKTGSTLSVLEKEQVKSEIAPLLNQIFQSSELVNIEKAAEPLSNEPEFIGISNGEVSDYAKFVKVTGDFFKTAELQKFNESVINYKFVNKENVIVTWGGSVFVKMKSGQQMDVNPFAASLFFTNIDGKWKVIYYHESGVLPPIEANK